MQERLEEETRRARKEGRRTTERTIAFVHTGAVVIAPINGKVRDLLPDVRVMNYLDDTIVADLASYSRSASVPERVAKMAQAAALGGAEVVMLTCSSISGCAHYAEARAGIPVLRIDEAMADYAVSRASHIGVVATLPTTCAPTAQLLSERAAIEGTEVVVTESVVQGAFAAISSGNSDLHDSLVRAAVEELATKVDLVVLAQASMAGAVSSISVSVPVLTSIDLGLERLAEFLAR